MQNKGKNKIEKIGFTINSWMPIIIFLVSAITSCTFAYYMILSHEHRLNDLEKKQEKDIEDLRVDYKRQYGVMEEKSQKQFEQGIRVATELKIMLDKHSDIIHEHDKEIQFQSGWREAEKFYKK